MDSTIKYITSTPKEVIGECDLVGIMTIAFNIVKNGDIKICFGDTTGMEGPIIEQQEITDRAYPNGGNIVLDRQRLWLSMFTRHMEDSLIIEFEEELEEK